MGGWIRGSRALRLPSTAHDVEGAKDEACAPAWRGARAAPSSDESLSVL
jgi:hypothetical protein